MIDAVQGLIGGFAVALSPSNLLYVMIGVLAGMVVGVLPGLGPVATIALLLPLTYYLPPTSAIIMLAGIYYGSAYGGTISSVLLRIPGEAQSVVTTFDGYPMAQQGRAGVALGIAAIGSFVGGTVALLGLTFLGPALASVALEFGPPEYTVLVILAMALIVTIGSGRKSKTLISGGLGLLLATVGQDLFTTAPRYTFGSLELVSGLAVAPIAMGLFGLSEVFDNLGRAYGYKVSSRVGRVWPRSRDWLAARGAIMRGSVLGFGIGILPGAGATVASLASYGVEKRRAKERSRFGKGAIEGVAGPETANNAAASASFIPLLTLGIPGSVTTAIIFGALMLQDISPGPLLMTDHPEVFWGLIASMYVGNIVLLALNVPLVGVFIQVLRVRYGILSSFIVVITVLGTYGLNNSFFEVWVLLFFGVAGYVMKRVGLEPGPLLLAFVLGPILERSFRQSLLLSDGGASVFVQRPLSLSLLIVAILILLGPAAVRTFGRRTDRGPSAFRRESR